jgi:hypothetical protein
MATKKKSSNIGDFFVTSEEYFMGMINADSRETAETAFKTLLEEQLVSMGIINRGLAGFLSDGKPKKKLHYSVTFFTVGSLRNKIIKVVENLPCPTIPMISFSRIEQANAEFMKEVFETKVVTT